MLENKLDITDQIERVKVEGKNSKQKANQIFESEKINEIEVGTFQGWAEIHSYLFKVFIILLKKRGMLIFPKETSILRR